MCPVFMQLFIANTSFVAICKLILTFLVICVWYLQLSFELVQHLTVNHLMNSGKYFTCIHFIYM